MARLSGREAIAEDVVTSVKDQRVAAARSLGTRVQRGVWPIHHHLEHQLLAGLSATERDTLRALLGRVRSNAASLLPPSPSRS